jgi:hypothetical protein
MKHGCIIHVSKVEKPLFVKSKFTFYELIYVPEYLVQKIDDIIKNSRLYRNREDFVFDAIEKFISDAVKEKIERSYIRKYG